MVYSRNSRHSGNWSGYLQAFALALLVVLSGCSTSQKAMSKTEQILVNERIFDHSFRVKGIGTVKQIPNFLDSLKPLTIVEFDTLIERKSFANKAKKKDTLNIKFNPAINEFDVHLKAEPEVLSDTTKTIIEKTDTVKENKDFQKFIFAVMMCITVCYMLRK